MIAKHVVHYSGGLSSHLAASVEAILRDQLGDVAILRDRRGGTTKPLPLSMFRQRIERGQAPAVAPGEDAACRCYEPEDV